MIMKPKEYNPGGIEKLLYRDQILLYGTCVYPVVDLGELAFNPTQLFLLFFFEPLELFDEIIF